jgi:transposase
VAGVYNSLGIEVVNNCGISKNRHQYLSHRQLVEAMALNCLGFVERRLYSNFFLDVAPDRILGESITPDHLNDDVLDRSLDTIAEYGPTEHVFGSLYAGDAEEYSSETPEGSR